MSRRKVYIVLLLPPRDPSDVERTLERLKALKQEEPAADSVPAPHCIWCGAPNTV